MPSTSSSNATLMRVYGSAESIQSYAKASEVVSKRHQVRAYRLCRAPERQVEQALQHAALRFATARLRIGIFVTRSHVNDELLTINFSRTS